MALDGNVLAIVRTHEPDRYLAALAAPTEAREDLLALAAFAAEVRRAARVARDPLAGEIRLTWWREAIAGLAAGGRTGHPLADALGPAIESGFYPASRLAGLIDSLAFDLSPVPFEDEKARAVYLSKTEGALFRLGLARLGAREPAATLIEEASEAYGLARASLRLDTDAPLVTVGDLAAAAVTIADLSLPESQRAREAISARLRAESQRAQAALRPQLAGLAPALRPALLPLVMVRPYLAWASRGRLPAAQPLIRVWRIWRAAKNGRLGD